MAAVISQFAGDLRLSYEEVTIGTSGALADNDSGLNTVVCAVGVAKDTNQPANSIAYVTLNYDGTDGLVDLYAWDDAGAAATGGGTVLLIVIGT